MPALLSLQEKRRQRPFNPNIFTMDLILKYFPHITEEQQRQYAMLQDLYDDWNSKINVISRKDIENLYLHHVLHSLAIAKAINFAPETKILDLGTGGGFPGIPLAIMFPECKFMLIDGTGKKIKVTQAVAKSIGLKNVVAKQERGEEEREKFDFVVSRAVMPLPDFVRMTKKNISKKQHNAMPNGIFCLKGGDITDETTPFKREVEITEITNWFTEEWFEEKYLIYIPI